MASIRVMLPELPSNLRFHEVRVKVVSKTVPVQSPGRQRFQRVVLRDEVGNVMRLSLFGDDVSIYDQIFFRGGFYDIMNVSIKEERVGSPYARGKVFFVTSYTSVKPVECHPDPTQYQGRFRTIRDALALDSMDETFDLACVVADVVPSIKTRTQTGSMVDLAKFLVTDDSYEDLIEVSLWGDLAANVTEFPNRRNSEGVITVEGLRKSLYSGKMTFTTAFGCAVSLRPHGPRVDELKSWYLGHEKDVAVRLEDSEQSAPEVQPEVVENIAVCLKKQASEVTVGQTLQFEAKVADFSDTSVRTSVGCARCSRASQVPIGERFICQSCRCPTTCVAKLYFDFTVRDDTGSICLHAQTRAAERILGISAPTFYMETTQEHVFQDVASSSRTANTSRPSKRARDTSQPVIGIPVKKRKSVRTGSSVQSLPKGIGLQYVLASPIKMKPNVSCPYCHALLLSCESSGICCCNGEVVLAPIYNSDALDDLYTRSDVNGVHFRTYCRVYNNFFAFSSLGGNIISTTSVGVHTLTIQGQIYHFLPSIIPAGEKRNYLQMYIYDGTLEASSRCMRITELTTLNPTVMASLLQVTSCNPYARFFRSIHLSDVTDDYRISISKNPILDPSVFNAPTTNEVAAILVGDDTVNSFNSPHIIVHAHADTCHRVMHYFGCYDPLQYPLLFTRGECGWFQGIMRKSRGVDVVIADGLFPISVTFAQTPADLITTEQRGYDRRRTASTRDVSCREFYAYRFQIRAVRSIINSGRVFLQYAVDMYIKIENTHLDFIRKNQKLLRSELYQGVVDSVNDGLCSASAIGRKVILPSSFIGGPRDVKQRYLNAMVLVQRFGRPDLFITMTCNPKWPEITALLHGTETAQDRPDVVARVFHAKVCLLKTEIYKKGIFGVVVARIDVIEFQKRGLPHVHILIILQLSDKIVNPLMYDQYVSAELPPTENPNLRALVIKHMMHGLCGSLNRSCACMKHKGGVSICRFGYPKDFAEVTTSGADSYLIYRRRDNGSVVTIRGQELDNRWVVPYNPYLLSAFDCHINVEICSTIKAVKYLYKYVYKGHDRVCFNLERTRVGVEDEPLSYQSGRWISPPEALWRILKFKLFDMYPAVLPVQIHMPNMQPAFFPATANLESVVRDDTHSTTMLTAYFNANEKIVEARTHLYADFPEWFVWHKGKRLWTRRVRPGCIGRLVYVAPTEGERFYLRLLLCNIRGATSFTHLRTVSGTVFSTFKEACEASGLLQTDDYAGRCMDEAIPAYMPRSLRRLFATLLQFVDGVDPLQLWRNYYSHMCEDYSYLYPGQFEKIEALTYSDVEKFLDSAGKDIGNYNIPAPVSRGYAHLRATRDTTDAIYGVVPARFLESVDSLTAEQRVAYDAIMASVLNDSGQAFFIDGPGGTGKTFLYCVLVAKIRSLGKIVLPTATSGIAASNIPMGRTAHSRFKIPLDTTREKTCAVSKQSSLANVIKESSLIIWDEVSMAKCEDVESVDMLLQDVCDTSRLFGGKTVVFGGDFRQILPVIGNGSMSDAVLASLVNSYIWDRLAKYRLTTNIRAQDDPLFADFLLQLGTGCLQTKSYSKVYLPDVYVACTLLHDDDINLLINYVYPEIGRTSCINTNLCSRAILCPTNEGVDAINREVIGRFPGEVVEYLGSDSLIDENSNACAPEFLNTLTPSGVSPFKLTLKVGCPVMLLRNLDPGNGLCNGTRLTCTEFNKNIITCTIASGYYEGVRVFIPRILLRSPNKGHGPFEFQRRQFPIKLCFAMTINKSQGQTLDRVALYLHESCFAHGQLYVACSRVRHRDNLSVFVTRGSAITDSPQDVINVISFDVIRRADIL